MNDSRYTKFRIQEIHISCPVSCRYLSLGFFENTLTLARLPLHYPLTIYPTSSFDRAPPSTALTVPQRPARPVLGLVASPRAASYPAPPGPRLIALADRRYIWGFPHIDIIIVAGSANTARQPPQSEFNVTHPDPTAKFLKLYVRVVNSIHSMQNGDENRVKIRSDKSIIFSKN